MRQVSISLSRNMSNSCYSRRCLFWGDVNVGSCRPTTQRKIQSIRCSFYFNLALAHCGITLKESRSNIGSLAESLQMSHVCSSYYRSSIWHTQAHRQQDSKWQSFPVDTCHPIYACLKHYHSITSLFYHVNGTVSARITVIANKP